MKNKFKKYFLLLIITFFAFQTSVLAVQDTLGDEGTSSQIFTGERTPTSAINADCSIIPPEILSLISDLWKILIIVGPLVFVVSAFMDILKLISSSDPKVSAKAIRNILKKFIALLVLILLPLIINFVLGQINSNFGTCGVG